MKPTVKTLLPKVRACVLQLRIEGRKGISLTEVEWAVAPGKRGMVQHCLSLLARDGTMFTRQKPECVTFSYERGTIDKRFLIRISPTNAEKQLKVNYGNRRRT